MSENNLSIPTFKEVQNAYLQIRQKVHRTPILTSSKVDERAGARLFFKCENFQKVGAFKFRGATHAISTLTDEQAAHGVATHSSGNHAQAVALAAKNRGIPAYIVMPDNAPKVKVNAVKDYNGQITFCESNQEARETTLQEVQQQTGATFIHPYHNREIIMGQGSAAIELLEESQQLDLILVPVGGGGLVSGTSIATKGLSPKTKVVGVEPKIANDAALSLESGELQPVQSTETVADGLRAPLSELTFACIREYTDAIVTVSEKEIIEAMRFIWERMKIIIEPSSAVPVAGVFSGEVDVQDQKVGVILSGGNVDVDKLPWV